MPEQDDPTESVPGEPDLFPEQELDEVVTRAPLTAKRVAIVGVRMVAGVVGLGVAVATVAASVLLPLPTVSSTAPSVLVTPVPTAQQLVCAGSVLRLADDTGQGATTSSAIGLPSVRSDSSSGAVDSVPLSQSDARTTSAAAAATVFGRRSSGLQSRSVGVSRI